MWALFDLAVDRFVLWGVSDMLLSPFLFHSFFIVLLQFIQLFSYPAAGV